MPNPPPFYEYKVYEKGVFVHRGRSSNPKFDDRPAFRAKLRRQLQANGLDGDSIRIQLLHKMTGGNLDMRYFEFCVCKGGALHQHGFAKAYRGEDVREWAKTKHPGCQVAHATADPKSSLQLTIDLT